MEAALQGAQALGTGPFCGQAGPGGKSVLEAGCGSETILEAGWGGGFRGQDDGPCRRHRDWGQAGAWVSEPGEKSGHCLTARTSGRSNKTVKKPHCEHFWTSPLEGPCCRGMEKNFAAANVESAPGAARRGAPRRSGLGTVWELRVSRCFFLFP